MDVNRTQKVLSAHKGMQLPEGHGLDLLAQDDPFHMNGKAAHSIFMDEAVSRAVIFFFIR